MAQIQEELVVVKLSKLVKEVSGELESLTSDDFQPNLEAIVQELVGNTVIVEVEKA